MNGCTVQMKPYRPGAGAMNDSVAVQGPWHVALVPMPDTATLCGTRSSRLLSVIDTLDPEDTTRVLGENCRCRALSATVCDPPPPPPCGAEVAVGAGGGGVDVGTAVSVGIAVGSGAGVSVAGGVADAGTAVGVAAAGAGDAVGCSETDVLVAVAGAAADVGPGVDSLESPLQLISNNAPTRQRELSMSFNLAGSFRSKSKARASSFTIEYALGQLYVPVMLAPG